MAGLLDPSTESKVQQGGWTSPRLPRRFSRESSCRRSNDDGDLDVKFYLKPSSHFSPPGLPPIQQEANGKSCSAPFVFSSHCRGVLSLSSSGWLAPEYLSRKSVFLLELDSARSARIEVEQGDKGSKIC